MFQGMDTGMLHFSSFQQSYWTMFVCVTFENFPDLMLEATAINRAYALFFIFFILVGNYFLMSVLLAVVFENYKNRLKTLQ